MRAASADDVVALRIAIEAIGTGTQDLRQQLAEMTARLTRAERLLEDLQRRVTAADRRD